MENKHKQAFDRTLNVDLLRKEEPTRKSRPQKVYDRHTSGFKHLPAPVGQHLNHFSTTKHTTDSDNGAVTTATGKLIQSINW